jgi:uncharacterized Ntn-hydrolase superfamily protein
VTLSLAAISRDGQTLGAAIASSSPAVAARCVYVRSGTGVVLTQNLTDPRLGPRGLDLLDSGLDAEAAIERLMRDAPGPEHRQVAIIDRHGRTGQYSGARALAIHAAARGQGVVAAGNLLASPLVPGAMVEAFSAAPVAEPLAARLLAGLEAGLAAGGESAGVHAAGIVTIGTEPWPTVDLRVDWSVAPVTELRSLWELWRPQANVYVRRALDPESASPYEEAP